MLGRFSSRPVTSSCTYVQRLAPATGQGCGQPSSSVAQEQHFHCKVEENTDLWIKQEPASYHKSEPESEPESEPSSASQQAPGSPEPAEWEVDDGPQRRSIRKRRAVAYSAESDSELDWVRSASDPSYLQRTLLLSRLSLLLPLLSIF